MATEHFYRFPFASTITRRISVFALIIHYNDFIGHTCNYVTQMVSYPERLGKKRKRSLRGTKGWQAFFFTAASMALIFPKLAVIT